MASYIGRRKFLATLSGVAAWPLATRAPQGVPGSNLTRLSTDLGQATTQGGM